MESLVSTEWLAEEIGADDLRIVDASNHLPTAGRDARAEYAAGHVPGALNRPFADNLDASGRFKPAAQLRAEFAQLLGSHRPVDTIHMCGSGVTACHNLLAMEQAGLAGSRIYAPSWSGWTSDPSRPVATNS